MSHFAAGHSRDVYPLRCDVQHYDWGDTEFIPRMLGVDNPRHEPFAELWMGAHPDLPSSVVMQDKEIPLNAFIEQAPAAVLGPSVAETFDNRLPYLFKVLSAAAPLSIQAHPSKAQAQAGFARENAVGVPLSAAHRNYKDDNHKPELIAALTDFYALRGFRPLEEIAEMLHTVPEFGDFATAFEATPASLRVLYESCMQQSQSQVDALFDPLIERLSEADRQHPFTREHPEYWLLRADRAYSREGHRDRGLFSIYFLNLVHLHPGEAMYLPAGVLHAYLEGSGMELMANSNNVLRGGLTPKHVDVAELLSNVSFEGGVPEILRAKPLPGTCEWAFATPAREFELRRIALDAQSIYSRGATHSMEILIPVEAGEEAGVVIQSDAEALTLKKGEAYMAPYGVPYRIQASEGAILYKATVPA